MKNRYRKPYTVSVWAVMAISMLVWLVAAPDTVFSGSKKKSFVITEDMLDKMTKLPGNLGPLPDVPIPGNNPQTPMKIELGKMLFFDPRLSGDGHISCATCHSPGLGYADGRAMAMGFREEIGRHSPTVLNAAYNKSQFWDGRVSSLEEQAKGPILAEGEMNNTEENVVKFLNSTPGYRKMFNDVFGHNPTYDDVGKAIASFERTIVTPNSPFDQYTRGDKKALSIQEKRGLILFVGKASCTQCHKGVNFSDDQFHILGVSQDMSKKADLGRYEVTKDEKDRRSFKTPTVRNITLTAPYMHNGSLKTLEEVIDFYNKGGGKDSNKDVKMKPLNLSSLEKGDLIVFLKTLTGEHPRVEFPQFPQ